MFSSALLRLLVASILLSTASVRAQTPTHVSPEADDATADVVTSDNPDVTSTVQGIEETITEAKRAKENKKDEIFSTDMGVEVFLRRFKKNLVKWVNAPGLTEADRNVILDNSDLMIEFNQELMNVAANNPNMTYAEVKTMAIQNLKKRWRLLKKSKNFRLPVDKASTLSSEVARKHFALRDILVNPDSSVIDIDLAAYSLFIGDLEKPKSDAKTRQVEPIDLVSEELKNNPKGLLESFFSEAGKKLLADNPQKKKDVDEMIEKMKTTVSEARDFYNKEIRGKSRDQLGDTAWREIRSRSKEIRDLEETVVKVAGSREELNRWIKELTENPANFLGENGDKLIASLKKENPETAAEIERVINKYRDQYKDLQNTIDRLRPIMNSGDARKIAEAVADEIRPKSKALRETEDLLRRNGKKLENLINEIKAEFEREQPLKKIEDEINRAKPQLEQDFNKAKTEVEDDLRNILKGGR